MANLLLLLGHLKVVLDVQTSVSHRLSTLKAQPSLPPAGGGQVCSLCQALLPLSLSGFVAEAGLPPSSTSGPPPPSPLGITTTAAIVSNLSSCAQDTLDAEQPWARAAGAAKARRRFWTCFHSDDCQRTPWCKLSLIKAKRFPFSLPNTARHPIPWRFCLVASSPALKG